MRRHPRTLFFLGANLCLSLVPLRSGRKLLLDFDVKNNIITTLLRTQGNACCNRSEKSYWSNCSNVDGTPQVTAKMMPSLLPKAEVMMAIVLLNTDTTFGVTELVQKWFRAKCVREVFPILLFFIHPFDFPSTYKYPFPSISNIFHPHSSVIHNLLLPFHLPTCPEFLSTSKYPSTYHH